MSKSLLPASLQDKNNLALEKCINSALDIDVKKFMKYPVENLSDELLEELARENHIMGFEGWNLAKTRKQKENLIKNSIISHAKKGSIPSIKEALSNLGMEAEIEEYFEYQGRPSHFKVRFLNIYDRSLDKKLEKEIIELINNYKPATRKLDVINYFLCSKAKCFYFTRIKSSEKTTISTRRIY